VAVLLITPDRWTLFVSTIYREFSRLFEMSLHGAEVKFFPGSASITAMPEKRSERKTMRQKRSVYAIGASRAINPRRKKSKYEYEY